MGVTKNYNRDKDPDQNVTPIDVVAKADEGAAPTPADLLGSDGVVWIEFQGDADEVGGTILEDLFRVDQLQVVLSSDGIIRLTGSIIPVLGDGSDGTTVAINALHPQSMDAWQIAAGRPQQP